MNTFKRQSKQPKPATVQEIIQRFKRDIEAAGMNAEAVYSLGSPYTPVVSIEIWPKKAEKEVTK